ncbi:hypothetical protein DXV76_03780 [Rhodobacteraceae bacterium CCMM004]|nr:hypothetical protein DXV76_03780 [Rhodobacteraceae bacterium CCMM004]
MAFLTPIPPATPWPTRLLLHVPLIGWMARDVAFGDRANLYFALVALISVWIMAVMTWGVLALYLPLVAFVPAMFVILFLITWG